MTIPKKRYLSERSAMPVDSFHDRYRASIDMASDGFVSDEVSSAVAFDSNELQLLSAGKPEMKNLYSSASDPNETIDRVPTVINRNIRLMLLRYI